MSINPETDLNLDELFQPSWAKGSDSKNPYAKFEPRERPDRDDRRGRPQGGGFNRPRGEQRGGGRQGGGPDRGRGPNRGFGGQDRSRRPEHREPPPPPPEVNVALHADDQGAESLARQIKTTGRAYPLFDIARMILQKQDRFTAIFSIRKGDDGKPLQPLFVCALDDTVWLSEGEAVSHVLRQHLATFYQAERTEIEAPKGTYTFVAQCGMSGVILGPPNHHAYQTKLRELHAKRYARMPFEAYKSRVKIVRDEAVVKQWVEEQSWKTEYICLNVPEATQLPDMAAVEKHFREVHQAAIIRQEDSCSVPGPACQKLRGGLYRIYRDQMDQQRRFPMQVATSLSQQFASRGLQFFKVNKSVTHVWVARPTFLDLENEPVSDTVRRIVQFINEHPKCTRRQLVETLAPSSAPPEAPSAPEAKPAEGEAAADTAAEKPATPPAPASAPTPEQSAIIGDLHWLIHQGHVIEFANGLMETAKKPAPRPQPAPKKKKKVKVAATAKPDTEQKPAQQSTPVQAAAAGTAGAEVKSDTAAPAPKSDEPAPTPSEEPKPVSDVSPVPPAEPESAPAAAEPAEKAPTAEPSAEIAEPEPEKQPTAESNEPAPTPAEPPAEERPKDPPATPTTQP